MAISASYAFEIYRKQLTEYWDKQKNNFIYRCYMKDCTATSRDGRGGWVKASIDYWGYWCRQHAYMICDKSTKHRYLVNKKERKKARKKCTI